LTAPNEPLQVTLLSNFPVPHQVEFLEELQRVVDLRALFLASKDPGRLWGEGQLESARILGLARLPSAPVESAYPIGLARELAAHRPDVLVIGGYSYLAFQIAMGLALLRRIPFVLWSEVPRLAQGGRVAKLARRGLIAPVRGARAILAIGQRSEERWKQLFPGKTTFNLPYCCRIDRYLAIDRSAQTHSAVTLLFSGQMIHRKGVDTLLQAFALASKTRPELRLLLAGDGPERARYEQLVEPGLRDRVEFLGFVPWEQLPGVYARADCLVVPSRHDGWALVVNEAFAAGLPVIATREVGAALDLVEDGRNGFLVPPENPIALAEAIGRVAASPKSFGAAGRELAIRQLAPRTVAAAMESALRQAVPEALGSHR
jgi:glycosyltransferase involved in cell wall biosynthesis